MQAKEMFGFYSEKMASHSGTVWYESPDTESGEIEVTCVSEDPWDSGVKWDDISYVGIVTNFLRRGRPRQQMNITLGGAATTDYTKLKLDDAYTQATEVQDEVDWDTYNNVMPWDQISRKKNA